MSNNELRERNRNRTTSSSSNNNELNDQQNENNQLNFDEDFVYLLSLSNFNWRIVLSPLLNLFNQTNNQQNLESTNNQTTRAPTTTTNRTVPNNSNPINQSTEPQNQSTNASSNQNASNNENDNLLTENLTETFDIHLNVDQNTILISRSHLIRVIFFKITAFYVVFFPSYIRKTFEYTLLASAILSFLTLIYLHFLFIRSPINCLQNIQWHGEGILRVEIFDEQEKLINSSLDKNSTLITQLPKDLDKNLKEFEMFSKQGMVNFTQIIITMILMINKNNLSLKLFPFSSSI